MRTFIAFILILTTFSFFTSSCEKTESYADKVKAEKKAIKRLERDSAFVFITDYPEDGVFGPKEFYRDPVSGAYFNVVDSGNGKRAVPSTPALQGTKVSVRYKNTFFFAGSASIDSSNMGVGFDQEAIRFVFEGRNGKYQVGSPQEQSLEYYILSPGLVSPLYHVGENAIVRLIIPFSAGSNFQTSVGFAPLFMGYVNYKFIPE